MIGVEKKPRTLSNWQGINGLFDNDWWCRELSAQGHGLGQRAHDATLTDSSLVRMLQAGRSRLSER